MADARDREIAELRQAVAERDEVIARLIARVAELEKILGKNSTNSGKPPSSDTPSQREERAKPKPSGRSRGAQPGHKGHKRALLPPEQVTASEDHFPATCDACGSDLCDAPSAVGVEPLRHQVVEFPHVTPDVTEHRAHSRQCTCGHVTRAKLPDDVPKGICGPRLIALISLLSGAYRMSRRQSMALLSDILGIRIALGTLSQTEERIGDALAGPVAEVLEHACKAPVKHVDGTGLLPPAIVGGGRLAIRVGGFAA